MFLKIIQTFWARPGPQMKWNVLGKRWSVLSLGISRQYFYTEQYIFVWVRQKVAVDRSGCSFLVWSDEPFCHLLPWSFLLKHTEWIVSGTVFPSVTLVLLRIPGLRPPYKTHFLFSTSPMSDSVLFLRKFAVLLCLTACKQHCIWTYCTSIKESLFIAKDGSGAQAHAWVYNFTMIVI